MSHCPFTTKIVLTAFCLLLMPYAASAIAPQNYLTQIESILDVQSTPQEIKLFADARDAQFDTHVLSRAALIASGVASDAITPLQEQIEALQVQAQNAFADYPPMQRAEALLTWLHQKKLHTYQKKQSLLDEVLSSGVYNCVSATVLYNSIGQQLGLDLRSVETSKHVFSRIITATGAFDVETTTQHGFNPNLEAIDQFERETGLAHVAAEDAEQRRQVGNVALVALIYFNQALLAIEAQDSIRGLHLLAKAMLMDPQLMQAQSSFISLISVLGAKWLQQQQHQKALSLLSFGLSIDATHETMRHNFAAGWNNWALASAETAAPEKAIGIIQRAYAFTKDEDLIALQAQIFISKAMRLAQQGKWSSGLNVLQHARKRIAEKSLPLLQEWRTDYLTQWLANALKKKHYTKAYALIGDLLSEDKAKAADNTQVVHNLGYLVQEWMRHLFHTQGAVSAERQLVGILADNGRFEKVQDAAQNYVVWAIEELNRQQQFDQAVAMVERQKMTISDKKMYHQLLASTYHRWSDDYLQQKAWEKAILTYQIGQTKLPDNAMLENNEKYAWNEWGKALIADKTFARAEKIYQQALSRYPKDTVFKNNLDYCRVQLN